MMKHLVAVAMLSVLLGIHGAYAQAAEAPATPAAKATTSQPMAPSFQIEDLLQSSAPTPAPTATAAPETAPGQAVGRKEGMLLLESDMAEASYKVNPTAENRDTAITALERLVAFYCMPQIHSTLQHSSPGENPKCRDYLDRTANLDPSNPIAVCAKTGIDSQECRRLSAQQKVTTFASLPSSGKGEAAAAELQAGLQDSKPDPELDRMKQAITGLIQEYKRSGSEYDQLLVVDAYDDYINRACSITRIKLVPTEQLGPDPSKTKKGRGKPNALDAEVENQLRALSEPSRKRKQQETQPVPQADDIIDRKSAAISTPTPSAAGMTRVRLITAKCKRAVHEAMEFDKMHPIAVCQYLGFFSPECIDTLRAFRAAHPNRPAPPGQPSPTPKPRDSLQAF